VYKLRFLLGTKLLTQTSTSSFQGKNIDYVAPNVKQTKISFGYVLLQPTVPVVAAKKRRHNNVTTKKTRDSDMPLLSAKHLQTSQVYHTN